MALIRVTANELRNAGAELRSFNAQLKKEFINDANALGATWEGDTKQAFMQATNSDKRQMDAFMALIEKYCTTIEQIAAEYDKAEANNASIANTRSY